jgi:hypothetical protein
MIAHVNICCGVLLKCLSEKYPGVLQLSFCHDKILSSMKVLITQVNQQCNVYVLGMAQQFLRI